MMLASQLPENQDDARLIITAVTELLDTFLAGSQTKQQECCTGCEKLNGTLDFSSRLEKRSKSL